MWRYGQFEPNPCDRKARPHLTLTPAVLVADFLAKQAEALIKSESADYLIDRLKDICGRAWRVTELHELMLAQIAP